MVVQAQLVVHFIKLYSLNQNPIVVVDIMKMDLTELRLRDIRISYDILMIIDLLTYELFRFCFL